MAAFLKMVKLDFYSAKPDFFFMYYMVIIIALLKSNITVGTLCFLGTLFIAMTFSVIFIVQESSRLDLLYSAAALTPKDIVLGRYIYILAKFFTALAITLALRLFAALCGIAPMFTATLAIVSAVISLFIFSILAGIQIPFLFYFGFTKLKPWIYFPDALVLLLALIFTLVPSFKSFLGKKIFLILMNIHLTAPEIITGGLLFSCAFLFISYSVSVLLYRRRRA